MAWGKLVTSHQTDQMTRPGDPGTSPAQCNWLTGAIRSQYARGMVRLGLNFH
eukprot:SAG11_NODE_1440_length_4905_cov_6.216188_8_plen_52_part_00